MYQTHVFHSGNRMFILAKYGLKGPDSHYLFPYFFDFVSKPPIELDPSLLSPSGFSEMK